MSERLRLQAVKDKEREMKQRKIDEEQRKRDITRERKKKKEENERIARMAEKVGSASLGGAHESRRRRSPHRTDLSYNHSFLPHLPSQQMSAKRLERKKKKLGLGNKKVAH